MLTEETFLTHSRTCARACVRAWWSGAEQIIWLQQRAEMLGVASKGSGHGVAGLNLPPGNPFRGQVCLLKEWQSSSCGL